MFSYFTYFSYIQKGIPKPSMSFHIQVLLSSESFPSLNPLYTDYSNKTTKAAMIFGAMIFGVMVHYCFYKDTKFSIFLTQSD